MPPPHYKCIEIYFDVLRLYWQPVNVKRILIGTVAYFRGLFSIPAGYRLLIPVTNSLGYKPLRYKPSVKPLMEMYKPKAY